MPAVRIPRKKEFWYKPVFRKSPESVEVPEKLGQLLAASTFDNNSENIGKAGGFPDRFQSYNYRRRNLEILNNILKHLGLQYDENGPMGVSDEVMRIIGSDSTIHQLERKWSDLEATLQARYRKFTKASGVDGKMREQK
ncbi:hypothetical protein BDY21DRAFT_373894 [Lineolata rhizophorae]|uniref:Uncharacterized protein n=1 Tax=Lineolata rhizophorae TaxID=578093 RepID=A0A6A6NSZ4_9PEZI|nr:hypothetical protein BDY21DRAFT_373894 [Lineolata rhizophorae]